MLANMALAKGHSSKTISQVSNIRTIGLLVFSSITMLYYKKSQCFTIIISHMSVAHSRTNLT